MPSGWVRNYEAIANVHAGRLDRSLEILLQLKTETGLARLLGLILLPSALSAAHREDEAIAVAGDAVAAARIHGRELWTCHALWASGIAYSQVDPGLAALAWSEGLELAREHRISLLGGFIARDTASLATDDVDRSNSLRLFDEAFESFQDGGNVAQLIITLAVFWAFLDRNGHEESAARIYGGTASQEGARCLPRVLSRWVNR
jgi:hypothetical protein